MTTETYNLPPVISGKRILLSNYRELELIEFNRDQIVCTYHLLDATRVINKDERYLRLGAKTERQVQIAKSKLEDSLKIKLRKKRNKED